MEDYSALDLADALEKKLATIENEDLAAELEATADYLRRYGLPHKGRYVLPEDVRAKLTPISQKESCIHILQGLISYHERMTMGDYPERDFYLSALKYAIESVKMRPD